MNQSEALVVLDLDDATLAMLTRICAKNNKTPSEVIHEIILDESRRKGLLNESAKSA